MRRGTGHRIPPRVRGAVHLGTGTPAIARARLPGSFVEFPQQSVGFGESVSAAAGSGDPAIGPHAPRLRLAEFAGPDVLDVGFEVVRRQGVDTGEEFARVGEMLLDLTH